jgi:hypothetical protein
MLNSKLLLQRRIVQPFTLTSQHPPRQTALVPKLHLRPIRFEDGVPQRIIIASLTRRAWYCLSISAQAKTKIVSTPQLLLMRSAPNSAATVPSAYPAPPAPAASADHRRRSCLSATIRLQPLLISHR